MWTIDENGNADGDDDKSLSIFEKFGVREISCVHGNDEHSYWIERDIAIFDAKADAKDFIKWLVDKLNAERD